MDPLMLLGVLGGFPSKSGGGGPGARLLALMRGMHRVVHNALIYSIRMLMDLRRRLISANTVQRASAAFRAGVLRLLFPLRNATLTGVKRALIEAVVFRLRALRGRRRNGEPRSPALPGTQDPTKFTVRLYPLRYG